MPGMLRLLSFQIPSIVNLHDQVGGKEQNADDAGPDPCLQIRMRVPETVYTLRQDLVWLYQNIPGVKAQISAQVNTKTCYQTNNQHDEVNQTVMVMAL